MLARYPSFKPTHAEFSVIFLLVWEIQLQQGEIEWQN
jgi:hypothetical protein